LIYLDTGAFDMAIRDFTRAHQLKPADPWPLANRGVAYAWKADRARALEDLQRAKGMAPSSPILAHGAAILELQEGNLPGAIDHLTEALRNDPQDAWSLRMRGDLYWKLGQHEKARDDDDRLHELLDTRDRETR
jgi:Flp pilus assembly protein TadD